VIFSPRNATRTNREPPKLWPRPFGVISAFELFSMQIQLMLSWQQFPQPRDGDWQRCRSVSTRLNSQS